MMTLEWLAAVVRGGAMPWPSGDPEGDATVAAAIEHGVQGLLARAAAQRPDWPAAARERLARIERDAVVADVLRQRELADLLARLDEGAVPVLLLKGTPLAFRWYETPSARPRLDTDLLVRRSDVDRVSEVLGRAGYGRAPQVTGELVSHQFACTRRDERGIWHAVDVHWRIANPQVFAHRFSFEDLCVNAEAVPALGPHARMPSRVHAIALACLHQVAHHGGRERLIWTHDVHLLARGLSPDEWSALETLAAARGLGAVCWHGLDLARRRFDTPVPDALLARLADTAAAEPAAYYVGGVGRLANLAADLRELPRWRDRAQLVREHLFPSADYMLRSYGASRRAWLPVLYAHRIVRGGWRWLRHA